MRYSPTVDNARSVALGLVGTTYPPGWCLNFQRTKIFRVPGVGDYDRDGAADAEDFWKAAKDHGEVVETSDPMEIPPGVMIAWVGGSGDYGHVAYALGNGEMVSTDLPTSGRVGRCRIDLAAQRWGHQLVGYIITDGNGFTYLRNEDEMTPAQARTLEQINNRVTVIERKLTNQFAKERKRDKNARERDRRRFQRLRDLVKGNGAALAELDALEAEADDDDDAEADA